MAQRAKTKSVRLRRLRPEEQLLFTLTRQHFLEVHQHTVLALWSRAAIDWEIVYTTATQHSVAPLVYANLLKCPGVKGRIPHAIREQFKRALVHNIAKEQDRADKIAEALAFAESRSLDVMLLKGAALDLLVYEYAWYTAPGDVDFLIRHQRAAIPEQDKPAITAAFRTMLHCECGYSEHHDISDFGTFPINFQHFWEDAIRVAVKGHTAFVMCPEDLLIAVCLNSRRKRFFRLKSLCDIAEITYTYPALQWDEVVRKAGEHDCTAVVYTALLITQATLGCHLSEAVLDKLQVHPIQKTLIHFLIHHLSFSSLASLYAGKTLFW